jgi:hypothetical protein
MVSLSQKTQQGIIPEPPSINTLINHHGLHLLIITRIIRPLLVAPPPPQHAHLCPFNDTTMRQILNSNDHP